MIGQVPSPATDAGPLTLDALHDCFEGTVPASLATVDQAGVPNVSFISQVTYVDPDRVALSYQFFNKTRRNILSTRSAAVEVVDPLTLAFYQLDLDFEATQSEGPVFESMKARLAGIASHTGMEGVFRLMGADIFRVRAIRCVVQPRFARPRPRQAAAVLWGKAGRLVRARHVPLCLSGGGAARRGEAIRSDPIRAGVRFVGGRAYVFAASDRQRSG